MPRAYAPERVLELRGGTVVDISIAHDGSLTNIYLRSGFCHASCEKSNSIGRIAYLLLRLLMPARYLHHKFSSAFDLVALPYLWSLSMQKFRYFITCCLR